MFSDFNKQLRLRQRLQSQYRSRRDFHLDRFEAYEQKLREQDAIIRDHQLTMDEIRAGGEAVMEIVQARMADGLRGAVSSEDLLEVLEGSRLDWYGSSEDE